MLIFNRATLVGKIDTIQIMVRDIGVSSKMMCLKPVNFHLHLRCHGSYKALKRYVLVKNNIQRCFRESVLLVKTRSSDKDNEM